MDYIKLALKALEDSKKGLNRLKKPLNESRIVYQEGMNERMHKDIEEALRANKTSLGDNPAFPEDDECNFVEKIMSERFAKVVTNYKRQFECDSITEAHVVENSASLVLECMKEEYPHREALEELAIRMIREEYDMGEDEVDIVAELTHNVNIRGTKMNESPVAVNDMDFDSTESIAEANGHVYKRRLLNAMTQGASMKGHGMFHMVSEELAAMNPHMPNKHAKIMANAEYSQFMTPKLDSKENGRFAGGVVRVQLPTNERPKPSIHVQAMVFPVLIHELIKGVMEILSAHGFTKDAKLNEYIVAKSDFLMAELDDQRIGAGLHEKFMESIDAKDVDLKHYVYSEIAAMPVNEFNATMKEIFAGTKKGKKRVAEIVNLIKEDLREDAYNDTKTNDGDSFDLDDFRGISGFDF
jgi:hypothetical protein